MLRSPSKLTRSMRVPWLGNRGFKITKIHRLFPIWHARQWQKLGTGPTFSIPACTRERNIARFQFIRSSSGVIWKALAVRMFETPALNLALIPGSMMPYKKLNNFIKRNM